jgi:hypothetical protein
MKILKGRIVPILGSVSLLAAGTATAQEYFRDFGSSRSSGGIGRLAPGDEVFLGNDPNGIQPVTETDIAQNEKNYNIRIGKLDLSLAVGVGIEFNDNIALSEYHRESDFIIRPEFDIEGAIRFSETNRLRLGIGLSYAEYLDHSQYSSKSVLVSPTSAIVWSAEAGAFKFTVRERFSYQDDPFDQPTLNVARYSRYENQAGIQIDWDANQFTKISVGFDRYDLWSDDPTYAAIDHSINTVFLRPSFQASPRASIGVNASYSIFEYRESQHANGNSLLVGPFVRWKVNDFTDIYAEVGFQQMKFNGSTAYSIVNYATGQVTGAGLDNQNASTWYAKFEIINRPAEHLRQKLSFTKTSELGYESNYYDLYHVEYSLDWAIREKTTLRPTLFYEYYKTSGPAPETAHRIGAALGIYHVFSDNFTAGLDYRFLVKDSNLIGADYYQDLVMLSLYYKF